MPFKMKWEPEVTKTSAPSYAQVTIRTGMSVRISNILTVASLCTPTMNLVKRLLDEIDYSAVRHPKNDTTPPGVPSFAIWEPFPHYEDERIFIILWGMVPTGAMLRGLPFAEFRVVVVHRDEVPDALDTVFDLARMLRIG